MTDDETQELEYYKMKAYSSSSSVAPSNDLEELKRMCEQKQKLQEVSTESSPAMSLREQAAHLVGKSPRTLANWVSQHKSDNGYDMPWVVRVNGMAWQPDIELLKKWLQTNAGKKVKKRGRPPKKFV